MKKYLWMLSAAVVIGALKVITKGYKQKHKWVTKLAYLQALAY